MECIKTLNQENLMRFVLLNKEAFDGVQSSELKKKVDSIFSGKAFNETVNLENCLREISNLFEGNETQKEKIQKIFMEEFSCSIPSFHFFKAKQYWPCKKLNLEMLLENYTEEAKAFLRPVIEEIIQCLKEGRPPCFEFLQYNEATGISRFALQNLYVLFDFLNYTCMDEFQKNYLEPFNRKFPWIDLEYAPSNIKQLDLKFEDVTSVDFSRFTDLEEIELSRARNFTREQALQLSARKLIRRAL